MDMMRGSFNIARTPGVNIRTPLDHPLCSRTRPCLGLARAYIITSITIPNISFQSTTDGVSESARPEQRPHNHH